MLKENEIWEILTQYLAKESNVCSDSNLIAPEMDIKADLNFDSLQIATMLMDLEDEFKIDVEGNLSDIKTVGDVFKMVLDTKELNLVK